MRLSITLAGITALNVVLSFAYQWYLVTTLGPGAQTDALLAGVVVPQLVLTVVSGSLAHVLVPLLAVREDQSLRRDAWTLFLGIGALFAAAALLLGAAAGFWVPLIVPGFDAERVQLTVALTRVQLVGVVCSALTSVLWAVSHARRRFIWVEVSAAAAGVFGLAALAWGLRYGAYGAAWAYVVRATAQLMLLVGLLGRFHAPDWRSPTNRAAWRRVRPLLLGAAYTKSDDLVDRILASMAPAGGITLLALSQQIYGAATAIVDKAVCAPTMPLFAATANSGRWNDFRALYARRIRATTLVAVAGYLLVIIAGEPALRLLIGHGNVTAENVRLLWELLVLSGGVWLGAPTGRILSMVFYSVGNTKTPTLVGSVAFTVSIALRLALFRLFGLSGLAFAMSLHWMMSLALLWLAKRADPTLRPAAG